MTTHSGIIDMDREVWQFTGHAGHKRAGHGSATKQQQGFKQGETYFPFSFILLIF